MIDLYQLFEKQEYSEIELSDGTSLTIRYNEGGVSGEEHTVHWSQPTRTGIEASLLPPDAATFIFHGKTARIAITAALQSRYPE